MAQLLHRIRKSALLSQVTVQEGLMYINKDLIGRFSVLSPTGSVLLWKFCHLGNCI